MMTTKMTMTIMMYVQLSDTYIELSIYDVTVW